MDIDKSNELETTTRNSKFDVIVVGGGMVGATTALAFAKQGKTVALLEKNHPSKQWLDNPPLRVSAINLGSEVLLEQLGIWQRIEAKSRCQFNRLATWEQGAKSVMFEAGEIGEHHLGYLVRNEAIQLAAFEEINEYFSDSVTHFTSSNIEAVSQHSDFVSVRLLDNTLEKELVIHAELLVGADGANSQVRKLLGIGVSGWDYQQHCMSITIKTEFPEQDITWQEFQPSGPKAFLPLADGYASLIWYDSAEAIRSLKAINSAEEMKGRVVSTFPALAGDFEVVQWASFPLTRRQANQYQIGRCVLVGDAAHTINPLAGQGVNLGYKDVSRLIKLLEDIDWSDVAILNGALKRYQSSRKLDAQLMSGAMDSFYLLFSNEKPMLKRVRLGLLSLANSLPWAKKQVLKRAVGY
jgi:2-octaprenyl-3-methyl-6-methoxy-1,4-benzoquinol hydroxylase